MRATSPFGRRTCPGHVTLAPFPLPEYYYLGNFLTYHSVTTPTALRFTCLPSGLPLGVGLVIILAAPSEGGPRPATGLNRQDFFLPLGTCKQNISYFLNFVKSKFK